MYLRSLIAVILLVFACAITIRITSPLSAMQQQPTANEGKGRLVVLVIDTSQSMARYIRTVNESLFELIDLRLADNDVLALVTFNDTVWDSGAPNVDHESIRTKMLGLRAAGTSSGLTQGLRRSLDVLMRAKYYPKFTSDGITHGGQVIERSVRSIIIISDGWDELRQDELLSFIKDANNERVAAHTVWLGRTDERQVLSRRDVLRGVSSKTGGDHTDITDIATIPLVLASAFERALAPASRRQP